jgi:hypothetical protein
MILFRGLIIGIIILILTSIAFVTNSQWAGILSAFPSTLFAQIFNLHFEEKERLYPALIYGFGFGVSTLVIFYLLCLLLLPIMNLNLACILIYLLCFGYLFLLNKVKKILML